jgi:DNA mismatch repair ATPase MutS
MKPLRDIYRVDGDIRTGIEAVGKIDELLSFYDYSKTLGEHVTMPLVTDDSPHYFVAKEAKNPILMSAKNIAKYTSVRRTPCDECMEDDVSFEETLQVTSLKEPFCIPNDIDLKGQAITILTGPNSGGKTTYAKTVSQMQLLAQMGCYVPAKEAGLSIADRIFYQAPMFDSLRNPEGRFGTELARTRDIFFRTTPRSLVVLDDSLAGATTHEETIQASYDTLDGFHSIGNNTLLITHNAELAKKLYKEDRGKYIQTEFKDGAPTYMILPGISEDSHSDVVSKKIGFSRDHIQQHLKNQKYLE